MSPPPPDAWVAQFTAQIELHENKRQKAGQPNHETVPTISLSAYTASLSEQAQVPHILHRLKDQLSHRPNRQLFRNILGLPLIVHLMTTIPSNLDLQIISCDILLQITEDDQSQKQVGESGAIEAILAAARAFPTNIDMLHAAFQNLRTLCLLASNRHLMLEHALLQVIVAALRDHCTDEKLVEDASAMLASVVYGNEAARGEFGKLGGIQVLTETLRAHRLSGNVHLCSGHALRNLAFASDANIACMLEAGTIQVLFQGMEDNPETVDVLKQHLAAVGNMVSHNAKAKVTVLENEGYIKLLFTVFATYAEDELLTLKISSTLRHLCEKDGQADRASTHTVSNVCVNVNGASAIVLAFKAALDSKNHPLLSGLASFISLLSWASDFRQSAGTANVLPILLQCLNLDDTTETLTSDVMEAMSSLLAGNDENKLQFKKLEGLQNVVQSMTKHAQSLSIAEKACKVLDIAIDGQNVTTTELLEDRITPAEAVKVAMLNFPQEAQLQEYSCSMLIKIASISVKDTSKLNRCGIMTPVQMAVETHASNPAVCSLGNQLLALLRSDRYGRSSTRERNAAGSRFRSRSRTLGERSHSRTNRSKSPVRDRCLTTGRLALLNAKEAQNGNVTAASLPFKSATKSPRDPNVGKTSGAKIMLESVAE